MATSTATLSAVLTLDDRASPGLVRASRNSQRLGADLRSAGQQMATFSASLASLLITTGALESSTGRYVTSAFALTGAFIAMIPALQTINKLLKTNATVQAFIATLTRGPVALGLLAGAGVAAAGTAAFLASRHVNSANAERDQFRQPRQAVTINNDLRGATIRGENDLNEVSRRVTRAVPPRF